MASETGGGGSSVGSDFFFFLGILVLFFFLWLASGGPSRPISFSGPYLHPITTTGTTSQAYGDPGSYQGISSGISIGGWGGSVTTGSGGNTAIKNPSSFSGNVSLMRDSSGATNKDEDAEYVVLSVSPLAPSSVSTAGWKLVSQKTGKGAGFPQGAETPKSGRVNALSAITLKPGDTATILSGRSPVGVSFRENKCTGYFEERQDFKPSLAMSCPTPNQEYTARYDEDDEDDECASFVRSIPYCSTETDIPSNVSGSCERFVEEVLTYNGCLEAHEDDPGFYSNAWRVFLGSNDELWRQKDETILLLDAQGKTIDAFSY